MSQSVRRVQDYALCVLRWLVLALLALDTLAPTTAQTYLPSIPGLVVPLPILLGTALYVIFVTIATFGGWAGSRMFAHFQSAGDLAILIAMLVLAPEVGGPLYLGLMI